MTRKHRSNDRRTLSLAEERAILARSLVAAVTLRRYLAGESIRRSSEARIETSAADLGLLETLHATREAQQ